MPSMLESTRAALRRKGLRRSRRLRLVAGVCGGLSELTGLNPWIFRAGFVLGNFLPGPGLLVYVILWFTLPLE